MTFKAGQSGNPQGRPRKREKHAGAIAKAEQKIAQKLPTLIDNMLLLANGVTVSEVIDGMPVIYTRPPDRAANEYLINRIMGKPIERKEVTGAEGGPIPVEFYSYDALASEIEDRST